jgi:hypothetical protein
VPRNAQRRIDFAVNEEPLSALLKTFPHTRYYSDWRLLTWHPRGLFDDALVDKASPRLRQEMESRKFQDWMARYPLN